MAVCTLTDDMGGRSPYLENVMETKSQTAFHVDFVPHLSDFLSFGSIVSFLNMIRFYHQSSFITFPYRAFDEYIVTL